MCWFLDVGNKEPPQMDLTGVQKAPRHEVAGSWAPAEQRALWGFNVVADLDGRRDARSDFVLLALMRSLMRPQAGLSPDARKPCKSKLNSKSSCGTGTFRIAARSVAWPPQACPSGG
jgi:hypothetical protein